MKKIRNWVDPVLRKPSTPVDDFTEAHAIVTAIQAVIAELKKHASFSRGIGLAAPQIGVLKQVSVVEHPDVFSPLPLINPQIISQSDPQLITEGCISHFSYRGQTRRAAKVTIGYQDIHGKAQKLSTQNPNLAMLLQHEIDHLNGILFSTRLENSALIKINYQLPKNLFK